jgi:hypothetical protein
MKLRILLVEIEDINFNNQCVKTYLIQFDVGYSIWDLSNLFLLTDFVKQLNT